MKHPGLSLLLLALAAAPCAAGAARSDTGYAPADARALAGDLPLGDDDGVVPGGRAEQSPQERGRQVEGQVPHDDGRVDGVMEGVRLTDVHPGQSPPQPPDPVLVEVDGPQRPAERGQGDREGAVAGSDLEDRPVGPCDEVDDRLDRGTVDQEVLAELMSAAV